MHSSNPPTRLSYSINNVRVARAAAEIAAHPLTNLGVRQIGQIERLRNVRRSSTWPACFRFFDHGHSRHDLPSRAETALECVIINECLLDWMKPAVLL